MADRITERRRYAKTAAKFAKLQALNELQDAGDRDARKAKKRMQDTWTNRNGRNPGELHKPAAKRHRDAGVVADAPRLPALPSKMARAVKG